eukprot:m.229601 g.229601  ORF g.229601 m.229601 type:complete len:75 (-) comp17342_c0_seq3:771-995(-)
MPINAKKVPAVAAAVFVVTAIVAVHISIIRQTRVFQKVESKSIKHQRHELWGSVGLGRGIQQNYESKILILGES